MLDNWSVKFPGCEPVAHRLKEELPTRWVRFHSLPGSKRYPDDQHEYAMMLGRQNRILDELVDGEKSVILLTTEYCGPPGTVEIHPVATALQSIHQRAKPWRRAPMHEIDGDFDEPGYRQVFASEWAWEPGVLDPVLGLVADDVISNIMVVDPDCRWLFHPYDGGMDLILESSAIRDRIKSAHADWLPLGPNGL